MCGGHNHVTWSLGRERREYLQQGARAECAALKPGHVPKLHKHSCVEIKCEVHDTYRSAWRAMRSSTLSQQTKHRVSQLRLQLLPL